MEKMLKFTSLKQSNPEKRAENKRKQDFNEINSYEVYIDRISQLKNISINDFNDNYNKNINLVNIVSDIQVNEDINSLYIESNVIVNENELLMLNYNYLNTEYVFIDKN